jgi:hypothetical protein
MLHPPARAPPTTSPLLQRPEPMERIRLAPSLTLALGSDASCPGCVLPVPPYDAEPQGWHRSAAFRLQKRRTWLRFWPFSASPSLVTLLQPKGCALMPAWGRQDTASRPLALSIRSSRVSRICWALRISNFGFVSGFGFRVSDFNAFRLPNPPALSIL